MRRLDTDNHCIRCVELVLQEGRGGKVTVTEKVSTIAGSTSGRPGYNYGKDECAGADARFFAPMGLAPFNGTVNMRVDLSPGCISMRRSCNCSREMKI